MLTLEEFIIQLDNRIVGFNDYKYYNDAQREEDIQLRNWLQELRVRRRTCNQYAKALKEANISVIPDKENFFEEIVKRNRHEEEQAIKNLKIEGNNNE